MGALTIRNVPDEVHRALRLRASTHGRSMEAEVRAIRESAVNPPGRPRLGSLLVEMGRRARLTDQEVANIAEARDRAPASAGGRYPL